MEERKKAREEKVLKICKVKIKKPNVKADSGDTG
jgi:hypothetical protein